MLSVAKASAGAQSRDAGRIHAMLVVVSDLHLTDGTSAPSTALSAFELFVEQLRQAATGASWRSDGHYRPLERLDVLLLGDTLDLLHSSRWLDATVRPWDSPQQPELIELVTQIGHDVLAHNVAGLELLRKVTSGGELLIPAADTTGRPASGGASQRVRVVLHCLVGEHDWFLHLPGRLFDPLRQAVARQLGLAQDAAEPLAHEPGENEALADVLRRHRVLARHGDQFDPLAFAGDRQVSSLSDALAIELVVRFVAAVANQLAEDLPAATLLGLRELENVRPVLLVAQWLDGLLARTCSKPALRSRVRALWEDCVERLLATTLVASHARGTPRLIDGLAGTLSLARRASAAWGAKSAALVEPWRETTGGSYARLALTEPEFRSRRAKYVVYGHTHLAESVPLEASYTEGYVLNQIYFNAGTWRRTQHAALATRPEPEFVASDVATLLAFYQGDERGGRPYECWSRTLGVGAIELPQLRVDPAAQSARAALSEGHPLAAPHFMAGAAQRLVPRRRS